MVCRGIERRDRKDQKIAAKGGHESRRAYLPQNTGKGYCIIFPLERDGDVDGHEGQTPRGWGKRGRQKGGAGQRGQ